MSLSLCSVCCSTFFLGFCQLYERAACLVFSTPGKRMGAWRPQVVAIGKAALQVQLGGLAKGCRRLAEGCGASCHRFTIHPRLV